MARGSQASGDAGRSARPVYQQIADELRAAVTTGELGDGDKLPGENELMRRHGVARATARQALAVLINEGLAVARRGSGVYVRKFHPVRRHGSRRLASSGWRSGRSIWEDDAQGRPYQPDRISVAEEEPPQRATRQLELRSEERVVVRRRRYRVEGRPIQLATSYLPAALAAGTRIAERDTGPGGVYARLAEVGYAPVNFTERLYARMPSPDERSALELPDGTPVIEISRIAFCAAGRPVELNEMVLDASSYVLQYDFEG